MGAIEKAYIVSYVIIALGILLGLGLVFLLAYLIYNWLRNKTSPVVRVEAVALLKRQREHDGIGDEMMSDAFDMLTDDYSDRYCNSNSAAGHIEFFIIFAFSGRRQEFRVSEEQYTNTHEGDKGLLIYKGETLKYFIQGVTSQ